MTDIPWPLSSSPGQKPIEGAGRLINVFAEQRGENLGPVWHRAPGASIFAAVPSMGEADGAAGVFGGSLDLIGTGEADGAAAVDGESV